MTNTRSFLKNIFSLRLLIVLSLLLVLPQLGEAARLTAMPTAGEYALGEQFAVNVFVAPEDTPFTNVSGVLEYNSQVIKAVEIIRVGAGFSTWEQYPTVESASDSVEFSAQSEAVYYSPQTVFIILFEVLDRGEGEIKFSNAVISNHQDSEETNLLSDVDEAQVQISAKEESEYPLPRVYSSTYPSSDAWYQETSGEFIWPLTSDITATAVTLSSEPDENPQRADSAVYTPPIDQYTISADEVVQGEQYLSIRHQYGDEWGPVRTRALRIDNTPPEAFSVDVVDADEDNLPLTLRLHATDAVSGIASYNISTEHASYTVDPVTAYFGYVLPEEVREKGGELKVVAYDKAGNAQAAENSIFLPAKTISEKSDESSMYTFTLLLLLFGFTFIFVVGMIIFHLLYALRDSRVRERRIKKESKEARRQASKIFRALRDEIEDQLHTLRNKKRLNKQEQVVVDNLSQALTVSETLLRKELEDVEEVLDR